MRYRSKQVEIDAIKFEYSNKGIEELKSFCGDALVNTSKNRHPSSIGEATVYNKQTNTKCGAIEGDYITKDNDRYFNSIESNEFEDQYELIVDVPENTISIVQDFNNAKTDIDRLKLCQKYKHYVVVVLDNDSADICIDQFDYRCEFNEWFGNDSGVFNLFELLDIPTQRC